MEIDAIRNSVLKLQNYIEAEKYSGYDPYDALKSPVFSLPFFRTNKKIRFLSQQFLKRFPVNPRSFLQIRKGYNPVSLGLCVQAYSNCVELFPGQKENYEEKINVLILELEKLVPAGYSGACWGYDFDWESRYAKVPAYQPTVVATAFVTNALFKTYQHSGNRKALELCMSAVNFVLKDLNRTHDDNGNFCFSYSPFDHEVVFNATMKAARLLAQAYSNSKEERLKNEARKTVAYVMDHQRDNGAWIYSKSAAGGWIDNYHTAYILDCLDEYMQHADDPSFKKNLEKGFSFYRKNFFTENGIPKFYNKEIYPVDSTAAAQSLLTLSRFNETEEAIKVAEWMIRHMQSGTGYFYFRKFKMYTVKTSFMRWSNAWMFLGLTELLLKLQQAGKN
jgi:hypothetical protein